MHKTGADVFWECLVREGIDLVYGYPGGAILPIYDAMSKVPEVHHVLTRHEQGATHMADGYARATGRVGVVLATSGPGATNLVTGIATAMMDSSPLVCITGQVPTTAMGSDAFQEADVKGLTLPITKHNYLVEDVDELGYILKEAFHVARSGRPGPVVVDIPKDVQLATTVFGYPEQTICLPGVRPTGVRPTGVRPTGVRPTGVRPTGVRSSRKGIRPIRAASATNAQIHAAIRLLTAAKQPVILAGHGVLLSGASEPLRELAERTEIPVGLTLLGKGGFAEDHTLCLGMMGMHGTAAANHAIQEADLLIACGMRFDDRVTGNPATYAPRAKIIHVDIDAAEIGKVVKTDVGIVGDLKAVLDAVLENLPHLHHPRWLEKIDRWRHEAEEREVLRRPRRDDELLAAQVIDALWQETGGDGVNVTDVGQHQMWEAQYFPHRRPHTLITSGGMGTMGFAIPAAIGVKMARPDEEVWAIVGDGGFQMTMAELATAVQEGVEIKIALINNGYLGMVRQWQDLFHEQRYNATPMAGPDFCRLAAAFDIPAVRVARYDQIGAAVRQVRDHCGGPALIEFVVEQHDTVYPMVPAGAALDDMIRRPHRQLDVNPGGTT